MVFGNNCYFCIVFIHVEMLYTFVASESVKMCLFQCAFSFWMIIGSYKVLQSISKLLWRSFCFHYEDRVPVSVRQPLLAQTLIFSEDRMFCQVERVPTTPSLCVWVEGLGMIWGGGVDCSAVCGNVIGMRATPTASRKTTLSLWSSFVFSTKTACRCVQAQKVTRRPTFSRTAM